MIRWPWVSRAVYEEARAHWSDANTSNEDWRHAHARILAMYDALLEKYHALKLLGASEPPPKAAPAKPDVVTQAIIARAKNSLYLRKHYAEVVRLERAQGTSEDDIAAGILAGHSDDNEGVA